MEKEGKGVCRICGCTETTLCWHPVEGYCSWADEERTICSHCANEDISSDPDTVHCLKNKRQETGLEEEYEKLYEMILSGDEDWDYSHLDRLLELHLMLHQENRNAL